MCSKNFIQIGSFRFNLQSAGSASLVYKPALTRNVSKTQLGGPQPNLGWYVQHPVTVWYGFLMLLFHSVSSLDLATFLIASFILRCRIMHKQLGCIRFT